MLLPKSILFVCTGNIFRSVSAELCLKKYLFENGIFGWNISSAGITAAPDVIDPKTLETLRELDIDASKHTQKKLTREMLTEYDIVIGMAENHIAFMKSEFNYTRAILFNELAVQEKTSVLDIEDKISDPLHHPKAVEEMIAHTVREISEKIPSFFRKISEMMTTA